MKLWRLIMLFLAGVLAVCAGCIGPHYSEHLLVLTSKDPPVLISAYDPTIEQNLSTNPWPKSRVGPFAGIGDVWFKSIGIAGWKDFHMWAKARGVEVQHQVSSSGFCTVDMRLYSLKVDDVYVPIVGTNKYMRLEIFLGRVAVDKSIRHQTNQVITAEGKLVWDSDGWFEIHPQKTGDVRPEKTP